MDFLKTKKDSTALEVHSIGINHYYYYNFDENTREEDYCEFAVFKNTVVYANSKIENNKNFSDLLVEEVKKIENRKLKNEINDTAAWKNYQDAVAAGACEDYLNFSY